MKNRLVALQLAVLGVTVNVRYMALSYFAPLMVLCLSSAQTKEMTTKKDRAQRMDRIRGTMELITQRTAVIRALYIVSVATNGPRDEVLVEFHQAVGDILEGMALTDLKLTYISKRKVREEVAWLRERR